jgi:probable rRNA maturation factor
VALKLELTVRWAGGRVDRASVGRAVRAAAGEAASKGAVSVAVVGDEEMAALNERHLGHGGPTDVISWRYSGEGEPLVAEVVVNGECAAREGAARGHGAEAELLLYVVHGVLHTVGYGDGSSAERAAIRAKEREVMSALGLELADS